MRPALIFCERTGLWCVALRGRLADCSIEMVETRSLTECRDVLGERPESLLVLEASLDTLPKLLSWLARLNDEIPRLMAGVVADRSLAQYEWAVREAGALAFVTSTRALGPLETAIRLYFAARNEQQLEVTERILGSLPWKSAAARATGCD